MPYAVIAHYRCTAQDAALIREALLKMREHTLKEPGNRAYEVHAESGAEPPAFILYEQYADRAAFDAHAASDHFAEHILGTVRPRLTHRDVLFGDVLDQRSSRPRQTRINILSPVRGPARSPPTQASSLPSRPVAATIRAELQLGQAGPGARPPACRRPPRHSTGPQDSWACNSVARRAAQLRFPGTP